MEDHDKIVIASCGELTPEQKEYLVNYLSDLLFGQKVLIPYTHEGCFERAFQNYPELMFKEKTVRNENWMGYNIHVVECDKLPKREIEAIYDALNYIQPGSVHVL